MGSEHLGFDGFNVYSPGNLSIKDYGEILHMIYIRDVPPI
jgi:hypothetical protein